MAQLNLRVEEDVKRKAESACRDMGLTVSAAINIFLIKLGNERRIPFEVSADPFYSDRNMSRLRSDINDVKAGKATLTEHELSEA